MFEKPAGRDSRQRQVSIDARLPEKLTLYLLIDIRQQ
jgi:hypothetical protein